MNRALKVGVNLVFLRPGVVGGVETYVLALLERMARLDEVELHAFCAASAEKMLAGIPGVRVHTVMGSSYSVARRLWTENVILRSALNGMDVVLSPGNFGLPSLPARIPQVAIIHDLQHLALPQHFTWKTRFARAALYAVTVRRCAHLVTISEFTRDEVIHHLRVAPERITAVPSGVSAVRLPSPAEVSEVRRKYALSEPYVYYPALDAPHKNHRVLLGALARLPEGQGGRQLVLSGRQGAYWEVIAREARDRGVADRVHHLGFIPYADVRAVLCGSSALVFPSEFEGFGLPILEAQCLGVPVIAADIAASREVAADGALLIEPRDERAWVAALGRAFGDGEPLGGLVAKGRANVERFSWERCAQGIVDVLRDVVNRRRA